MRRPIWIILILLFFSIHEQAGLTFKRRDLPWQPPPHYEIGEPVIIPELPEVRSVWLAGRPMTYLPLQKVWLGIAPNNNAGLVFWFKDLGSQPTYSEIKIPVHSQELKSAVDLQIPKAVLAQVGDAHAEQKAKDRELYRSLINKNNGMLNADCWQLPLLSSITSPFGSPRRLPDGATYHHSGEDRRAEVGRRIRAAGTGRVVFAGEMILPGRNVLIDHGGGWFSRYLHLSEVIVTENLEIKAGTLLGKSGATGRVDAPHLHWEILWRGIPADPRHFLPAWARLCDQG